jgi:integration host factor subunit beta
LQIRQFSLINILRVDRRASIAANWQKSVVKKSRGYFLLDRRGKGMVMIRSELVHGLGKSFEGLNQREIDQIVDLFFDKIIDQLAEGGRVELRGFGTFSTRSRDSRSGRNPRTGETVEIDSKRVPYFKPGKEIRQRLAGS